MRCPKCNNIYSDEYRFCPYCGEGEPEPKVCANCNEEFSAKFTYCPKCGKKLMTKAEIAKLYEWI